jgi:hypothetical protein
VECWPRMVFALDRLLSHSLVKSLYDRNMANSDKETITPLYPCK